MVILFILASFTVWLTGTAQLTAVVNYDFLRSECQNESFKDSSVYSSGGSLIKNSNVSCLNSNGIGGFSVSSKRNQSVLFSLLNDDTFSFSLWVQPQFQNQNNFIFGYGNGNYFPLQCRFNVLLSQGLFDVATNSTEYILQLCYNGVTTGNILSSGSFPVEIFDGQASIVHLTFSVQYSTSFIPFVVHTVYCEATVNTFQSLPTVFATTSTFVPSVWLRSDSALFIPSTSGHRWSDLWMGKIYSFSMFSKYLSSDDVCKLYSDRIVNSLPVVYSQLVTIQQNGEIGDHSKDPEYYLKTVPSTELEIIRLPCYDFDDQPISPLYNASIGPTMKVFLSSLPFNNSGVLYYLNGSVIMSSFSGELINIPFDKASGSYPVRYRPPFNVFSENGEIISNFTVVAVDGITGLCSVDHATVSINVSHVDRPPIAQNQSCIVTAKKFETVMLLGSDQDSSVIGAEIVAIPNHGDLYHIGNHSKLHCYSNSSCIISMGNPITLGYEYSGAQTVSGYNDSFVGSDEFSFALIDTEGRRSVPVKLTINAYTALSGIVSPVAISQPFAIQASLANVSVLGYDAADIPRVLSIKIMRIPNDGKLVGSHDVTLSTGDSVPGVISNGSRVGLNVLYIGNQFYFNIPTVSWNGTVLTAAFDSFDFLVYTQDGAESVTSTQYVSVLNVNDPTDLGYKRNSAGYLSVYQYGVSAPTVYPTVIALEGFSLLEFDKNVDVIRAAVSSSSGGELTLNPLHLSLVDFSSNAYCFAEGGIVCVGDGVMNDQMVFVGTPYAVESVLNGMSYLNRRAVIDFVNVTIYDGVGGNCFLPTQPNSGSVFNECFVRSVVIEVRVMGHTSQSSGSTTSSISFRIYYIAFGLLVTFLLAVCRCIWLRSKHSSYKEDHLDCDNSKNSNLEVKSSASLAPRTMELEWSAHQHENGRVYYYNERTHQSTWKRPYTQCNASDS